MGIYPDEKWERKLDKDLQYFAVHTIKTPGLLVTETYELLFSVEDRTDCFCCSCHDGPGGFGTSNDPYCRNHGWAASRPCELHGMPGQEDENGVMPDSVQAQNKRNEEREEKYRD